MIISDIDYLESLSETYTKHLNGGRARAIAGFSADAYGNSTNITTVVKNQAISRSGFDFANSSVRVTSTASGNNAISSASAFSSSSVD